MRAEDAAALKREIADKLTGFRDPETGEVVIETTYDGAEIYLGRQTDDAPDLVIGYASGYRASWQTAVGGVPEPLVEDNDRKWSGDHCIEPSSVPGILFTSFQPATAVGSIAEVPNLIRETIGLTGTVDAGSDWAIDGRVRRRLAGVHAARRCDVGLAAGAGAALVVGTASAAFASMGLYRLTSNQSQLAANKEETAALQKTAR